MPSIIPSIIGSTIPSITPSVMINHWLLFFVLIFMKCSDFVHCIQSYDLDFQLTFDNLTHPSIYQKWIRPPVINTNDIGVLTNSIEKGPLFINMSVDLYNYAIVDEITSEYTFHLFIDLEWFDTRLKFPSGAHNELVVEGGQYHIDKIWTPTIFVVNNQDPGSFDYDHESANFIRLKPSTGFVWLRKRKMLRIYCDMDFHLYPFDKQKCELQMESSVSTIDRLKLLWRKEGKSFSTADNFRTIGFSLGEYVTKEDSKTYSKNNTFSRVSVSFTLEREWAHHIFLFYIPSAIIVIASWSSFWLEITSPPARASIGVTTMLALVTTFKSTKSQLPNVPYWNALDIWNMICIVFIFSSLIEFSVVNYIFNTEKRKKRNKKLKRKRQNTILRINESQNTKPYSRLSSLNSLFESTVSSSISDITRLSELSTRRKSSISRESIIDPMYELNKRRRSSVTLNVPKPMSNIKEEPSGLRSRRASAFSASVEMVLKLTPEELANEIDRKCRRLFPLTFIVFNFLYWTFLLIRF